MKISTRARFYLITILVIVIGIAAIPFFFDPDGTYFSFVFFGWICIGSFLVFQVKCPNCGTPVVYQGKVAGVRMYAGFVRKQCQCCRYDLTSVK